MVTVDILRPVANLKPVIPESSRTTGGEVSNTIATVVEFPAVCRVRIETVWIETDLCRVH